MNGISNLFCIRYEVQTFNSTTIIKISITNYRFQTKSIIITQ